jgi:predicted N-acetyltransferase YhbS
MAASDHLSKGQFKFVFHPGDEEDHAVTAHETAHNSQVGLLTFDSKTGHVTELSVQPEYRRKGVATGMWTHAKRNANIQHASTRTLAGDAWAKTTGDYVPPRHPHASDS